MDLWRLPIFTSVLPSHTFRESPHECGEKVPEVRLSIHSQSMSDTLSNAYRRILANTYGHNQRQLFIFFFHIEYKIHFCKKKITD